MSYTVTTTFVDTQTTSATDLAAEVSAARTFINTGIVTGDLANDVVKTKGIYRPELFASPIQGQRGVFHSAVRTSGGLTEPPSRADVSVKSLTDERCPWLDFGKKHDRVSIFIDALLTSEANGSGEESTPIPGMCKRIVVPSGTTAKLVVTCHWEAIALYYTGDSLANDAPAVFYPGYSGASGHNGGWFQLWRKRVESPLSSATAANRFTASRRHFLPQIHNVVSPGSFIHAQLEPMTIEFSTMGYAELGAGVYDVWLEYNAATEDTRGADGAMKQISVGARNMVLEWCT